MKPRIGLLGIMQELYDDMLPGITERQDAYARAVAARLSEGVRAREGIEAVEGVDVEFIRPARDRHDIEEIVREYASRNLDGIAIVMLTYGPAMRSLRALSDTPLPLLLANIQPERAVTAAWDMGDLTYNQGIHGAQDQANALVRASVPFSVLTGEWDTDDFVADFGAWARAAATVTALRSTRLALFGYPMNGMGDILYDQPALARRLGPQVVAEDLGGLYARMQLVADERIDELIARDSDRFEIDPSLPRSSHAYAARFEAALRDLLDEHGLRGFTAHFDSLGNDGRFEQLPLLAASNLMADGYGYAAEGDTSTLMLMCAAQTLIGDAHFSELYAMDFALDSLLVSHMGEGNWRVARRDRPVRLIDRELGIGGLSNPPTAVFSAQPGPATTAALAQLSGEDFRLIVGHGEVLDTPELPNVQMPYFHFRPYEGVKDFMDGWLSLGGPHHFVTNLGEHGPSWRRLAELLDVELLEL